MQASELNIDPHQDRIEVKLVRDKNTSRSKGGRPTSSTMSKGGFSNAQYTCGFGIFPYVSRTGNAGFEEVIAELRALDEKFNTMQSLLDAVMAKLAITVEKMASTLSRGEHPSNIDKEGSNSRRSVTPLALLMSKEPISKLLDFGSTGDKPIILRTKIPCGSQKASSRHEESEQI